MMRLQLCIRDINSKTLHVLPSGASSVCKLKRDFLMMKCGGSLFPPALTAAMTVIVSLLSLVLLWRYFVPFRATILPGLCSSWIPVSSIFQIAIYKLLVCLMRHWKLQRPTAFQQTSEAPCPWNIMRMTDLVESVITFCWSLEGCDRSWRDLTTNYMSVQTQSRVHSECRNAWNLQTASMFDVALEDAECRSTC